MDDITKTQQSFARKALMQPEHRFADVYHLICREEWIRLALSHVLANTGSRTAGVDGVTKRQFKDDAYTTRFITGLQTALKTNTYRPEPVKRHYINKSNGRKRPLGIPISVAHCLALQAMFGIPLPPPGGSEQPIHRHSGTLPQITAHFKSVAASIAA